MNIEELKSMSSDATYYVLNYVMSKEERKNYIPAEFDEKNLLPVETLYDLFDGNCVTNESSANETDAIGFISDIPTIAIATGNKIGVRALEYSKREIYDWYDQIFENFCEVFEGTIRTDNTIYDSYNDVIICIDVIDIDKISFSFYFNVEEE